MISLAGKAALITGGSRGIGAATVKLFAQAGADVVFGYARNSEAAAQVEQEARKHSTRIESCKTDLAKLAGAKKLVEFALERLGRLDILVANAGIWTAPDIPIEKLSEREWDEMMQVNLKSVYSVIHLTAPHMIAQRGGRIIAISSTSGQRGEAFHTHYSATKGAIISFVKGLATELARHNILVNCVAPGWVDTDMSKPTLETKAGAEERSRHHTAWASGAAGRNSRPDPLRRVGSSEFYDRRGDQRQLRSRPVRMKRSLAISLAICFGMALAASPRLAAQDDGVLMPDQSTAKARQILQAAIQALGGQTYLNVHDVTCTGNIGQFDHAGNVTGYGKFIDYSMPPDKERQENLPKRNIIEIYNGKQGWVLDRGGVSDAPASDVAEFQQDNLKDIDNILRHRIHEPGMILRYAGPDIVQLKQADWVELVDNDNRTIRIAFAQATHLPIQEVAETRDPKTQLVSQETDYLSDYHEVQGIQTAFQLERDVNGVKRFQAFFAECDYNTNLSDSLFTRESLEERWAKIGKKERKKEEKDKKKDEDKNSKKKDSSSNKDW